MIFSVSSLKYSKFESTSPSKQLESKIDKYCRSVLVNLVSTKPKLSIVSSKILDNTSIAGETIV